MFSLYTNGNYLGSFHSKDEIFLHIKTLADKHLYPEDFIKNSNFSILPSEFITTETK